MSDDNYAVTKNPFAGNSSGPLHWQHILDKDFEWSKKDLLNMIYWIRQIIAIIIGPLFGYLMLEGSTALFMYVGIQILGLFSWYGKYLQIDVEEFSQWDLATEGFMPSFALFIVSLTFTSSHHSHSQSQRRINCPNALNSPP